MSEHGSVPITLFTKGLDLACEYVVFIPSLSNKKETHLASLILLIYCKNQSNKEGQSSNLVRWEHLSKPLSLFSMILTCYCLYFCLLDVVHCARMPQNPVGDRKIGEWVDHILGDLRCLQEIGCFGITWFMSISMTYSIVLYFTL